MRAIVVDNSFARKLTVKEVPDVTPSFNDVVIRVEAVSLNQGEVRHALTEASAGWIPGWDFAGIVEREAADGTGPKAGDKVVGFREEGAWQERVAVPARALAVLPENVTTVEGSTLPVAGLTALFALAEGGLLIGKKVLINGASGGVGHFAVQIARASGAFVVACVRRETQRELAESDGAHHVIVSETLSEARDAGPFDLIIESAGGAALSNALGALAGGGACVSCGNSNRQPLSIDPFDFYYPHGRTRLIGFYLLRHLEREPPREGLSRLGYLTGDGILRPRIEVQTSWHDVNEVAERFLRREYMGKVVLRVT